MTNEQITERLAFVEKMMTDVFIQRKKLQKEIEVLKANKELNNLYEEDYIRKQNVDFFDGDAKLC
jgi:hypothetical protein